MRELGAGGGQRMTQSITAIFANQDLAEATLLNLMEVGIQGKTVLQLENDTRNEPEKFDDYLNHKLNQGEKIIQFTMEDDQWIAIHEIICSFGGEVYMNSTNYEVINRMYSIPEESYEQNEMLDSEKESEIGTLGYPNDQLDDNAFIDPNFGIGNYDLLIPFMDQSTDDKNTL